MAIKRKDKSTLFLLGFLGIIIGYMFVSNYFRNQTKTNYQYNIATVEKVISLGKSGWRTEFTYNLNENKTSGRYNIIRDSVKYYNSQIGKRFLVKMSDKPWVNRIFFTYELYINKPVPDSIEAPIEGWKELPDWARE